METIGDRISKARRHLDLSQKELCQIAGITEGSLSRYENNIREPKCDAIKKLSKALDVSTDYLMGLTDEMNKNSSVINYNLPKDLDKFIIDVKRHLLENEFFVNGKKVSDIFIYDVLRSIKAGALLSIDERE